ncbi:amidotransferase 1, exosortase A system-associated [Aliiglaciecola sp. CAU 1673]|uniref:XrtA/PEP-CTERM system amidotransferase n=1 Tax=Aliiglaciecola sp. CAU 1673 TaxID=3032595 RepID=UPI0023D9F479|nr:XrtA/PEP-CTERM system amidotransferase [Aliiglaciecola sp. CAU 1673]MDF2177288.1 amidotransferase 1, exosortase A system-associated [Aliiglaciecola sp. CAU 1673]
MCGIAGIFHLSQNTKVDEHVLQRMNDRQHYRGPDAGDYFFEAGVGLAHRRLSIIDLEGSPQPMQSADKRACVVFNGEIYNFKELHKELSAKGYKFNTQGDTETILNAWLEWGEDCVHKLRGMFAFAIWDREKRSLFVARDRLGIKPLFYSLLPSGEFIFGSELKVLVEHPLFDKRLRNTTIEDYFTFGYIPEPHTVYQNAYKLAPGHCVLIKQGQSPIIEPKQYWDIPLHVDKAPSAEEVQAELIDRLKQAVDIRLVADVPLGAFLSGGVDSSAIVALMSQLQPDPVNTCAIGFDVARFNETQFAQMVADRYKTNHRVEIVSQDDFDLIDKLSDLYDEPYSDSSAMPTYRVCELARKHVTVALSGDGGDELFAGYRRYRMHLHEEKIRNLLPLGLRKPLFGPLGALYPKLDWAPKFLRAKTTFQSMAMDTIEGYHNSISILRRDERHKLFSNAFKQTLNGYNSLEVFRRHGEKAKHLDPLKVAQYIDMKTYLVGDILTKVDRASMAHSLEVRVPILDHKFVEWAFHAPSSHNLHGGEGKYSFKKALEPHLPHDVLYRKKMGFAVPLADWFRGPLKGRLYEGILSERMKDSGYFDVTRLKKLVDDHVSGVRDNSASLWTLMMFESFLRKQLGR